VRIALSRCRPSSGCSSAICFTAARMRQATAERARSAVEPA
jgi:hypothetical protein